MVVITLDDLEKGSSGTLLERNKEAFIVGKDGAMPFSTCLA